MLACRRPLFFFQAEDGIRDLVRSRGLGDVYKRQVLRMPLAAGIPRPAQLHLERQRLPLVAGPASERFEAPWCCLLYTSDAADERSSVDLGGRRIIKKKKTQKHSAVVDN